MFKLDIMTIGLLNLLSFGRYIVFFSFPLLTSLILVLVMTFSTTGLTIARCMQQARGPTECFMKSEYFHLPT